MTCFVRVQNYGDVADDSTAIWRLGSEVALLNIRTWTKSMEPDFGAHESDVTGEANAMRKQWVAQTQVHGMRCKMCQEACYDDYWSRRNTCENWLRWVLWRLWPKHTEIRRVPHKLCWCNECSDDGIVKQRQGPARGTSVYHQDASTAARVM